jgi:hypothetical protein
MNDVLSSAIREIATLENGKKKRIELIALSDGRTIAVDQVTGMHETLVAPKAHRKRQLADLDSLVKWCRTLGTGGDVLISRTGTSKAIGGAVQEDARDSGLVATVDFFDDFLPPDAPMSISEFIQWFDKVRAGIDEEGAQKVDGMLAHLTAEASQGATVMQSGSAISVKTEAKAGVVAGGKPLPKRIQSEIPFGDPSFKTPVTFTLVVELSGGKIQFRVSVDELEDTPREKFVAWAVKKLEGDLFELDAVEDGVMVGRSRWAVMVAP